MGDAWYFRFEDEGKQTWRSRACGTLQRRVVGWYVGIELFAELLCLSHRAGQIDALASLLL